MSHNIAIDETSHVVLVDGSGYIFRAYHALPPLTRKSDGLPIGAVAGFSNMLFKLLQGQTGDARPTHFAVIFDASGHTFRNEIYDLYKANRSETPEDLIPQFPLTRDATRAFGAQAIEMEGYEADDLIATYADIAEKRGARVTIISSDKDLMQLVSDKISMLDTMKDRHISFEQVREKFGVGPDKVIDIQSLAGDSVDNVPGVPGIGVKTAALLIEEYGDLDTLLERAGEIKQKGRREKLLEFADNARISRELVTLKRDIDLEVPLEELGIAHPEPSQLFGFLEDMEFRTLTARVRAAFDAGDDDSLRAYDAAIAADPSRAAPKPVHTFDREAYACVQDLEALAAWIEKGKAAGVIAVDLETDSLDSAAANLVGICLATGVNEACYIPLAHVGGAGAGGDMFGEAAPKQIAFQAALDALEPLLHDPSVLKVGQNFKYDLGVFSRYSGNGKTLRPAPYDDTMLISYSLEGGLHGHGMDAMAERHFDHSCISFKSVAGTGKSQVTFDKVALDVATPYAAEDADVTLRLWHVLKPRLANENVASVYETLERDMPATLAHMENQGIKVDRAVLARLSSDFAQKMAQLEDQAHELAGRPFNVASPKQLGEILFDDLGLPGGKKTKTGAWQTGAAILEELASEHALPKAILDHRHYAKLKSTYTDALTAQINPQTGRVHTSFALAATTTGRLSSSDPNLQNIPIRTEDGRKIRDAFIAEPGHVLVAADYSQIELRILAHVADLTTMKQAFSDGVDIHALTASEMFGVPIEGMDPITRRNAKAINFGIIYGISAFGLANNLNIGRSEAKDYIDSYFEKFPGIKAYMEAAKDEARNYGYVTTLFGRKCHIKGIKDRNAMTRAFGERQAINAPIQGAAADVMRRAMLRMPGAISGIEGARMLLQVHDELVFEVPEGSADRLMETAKSTMEGAALPAVNMSVPLIVDAKAAKNWNDAH